MPDNPPCTCGNCGACYDKQVIVSAWGDLIKVEHAPDTALIDCALYEKVAARTDEFPWTHCEAGEGWFVIHASNGIFRYRLTDDATERAYVAKLATERAYVAKLINRESHGTQ